MTYFRELGETLILMETAAIAFVDRLDEEIRRARRQRVFVAGNGGSAAIASHFVTDVMKTSCLWNPPSVICLTDNVPMLTACANDVSWERALEVMAEKHNLGADDVVIVISSSGNSENVVRLAATARRTGASLFSLVGFDGGKLKLMTLPGNSFHVAVSDYGIVEDTHHAIMHALVRSLQREAGGLET
jgi:D-sedoheptulose 7-phosphate isomerase